MATVFRIQMTDTTIVADGTLVFIRPNTSRHIRVVRFGMSQRSATTAAQLGWSLGTKATAFGTYTAATPKTLNASGGGTTTITGGTAGAAGTAGVDASVEGGGTHTVLLSGMFSNLVGVDEFWGLGSDLILPADSAVGWALKLLGTPSALTGWDAFIDYTEE